MNKQSVETEDSFTSLLDLASNNDIEGFKRLIERDNTSNIEEIGIWLILKRFLKQVIREERTPLMIAALYGSLDIVKFILSQQKVNINQSCGQDKWTALHCATAGGSVNGVHIVKLLLSAGADPNLEDAHGLRPVDVMVVPPNLSENRVLLEKLLINSPEGYFGLSVITNTSSLSSLSSSSSPESSPASEKPEKKEYPIDPSLPDIKNVMYSTDEFRMFSFKVRPCSRAYSHDWTECPFVHPGENARRRDPRKYHYSCVPCPEFRKGTCRRGDMCEYAHGVFECWLHPAQYRTRLCKDGTSCARRVCFFAHVPEELRPLYVSTGSAVPSPRSMASTASVMDMMSLFPSSPSSMYNQLSPTNNGSWAPQNVPSLNLPGSNLQSSRLRSSLSARDILPGQQLVYNDMAYFSNRPGSARVKTLTPSNLDELFSSEMGSNLSPRYNDQVGSGGFSPSYKSAVFNSIQLQQGQNGLSPINTNLSPFGGPSSPGRMSPRSVDPISPMSGRLSAFANREKQLRSISARELGSQNYSVVGSPINSWSNWGSPSGKADWSVNGAFAGGLSEPEVEPEPEPDVSWVQSLVKESSPEMKEKSGEGSKSNSQGDDNNNNNNNVDHSVLSAWIEQMQLDNNQLVA